MKKKPKKINMVTLCAALYHLNALEKHLSFIRDELTGHFSDEERAFYKKLVAVKWPHEEKELGLYE